MSSAGAETVFVFPPAVGNLGAFRSHLGVAYLRAALARDGLPTTQYVNPSSGTTAQLADSIIEGRPRVVGFTVYDANFGLCLALARRVKARLPDARIVFGGPSATFNAREILARHPVVDACVLGEAEETGGAAFAALLSGGVDDDVPPGMAVRRDGGVVASDLAPLSGMRSSALPATSMLDALASPYLDGLMEDGRAGVLTGRGCTHHCQYCCFAALGRKRLRLHSIDRVLAELEWIAAHQKRTGERYIVPVHDDAFTLLPGRAKSLCRALADRHLDLVLSCITRADAVDEELLRLMREAGFVSVAFGLESSVPSVLRATGKVRPPDWPDPDLAPEQAFVEQVRQSVLTAKKVGFHVGVSIILGLPTETAADGAATLEFVKSLPVDFYMHNFLWVFAGTPLWDSHERYGVGCTTNFMGLATTTDYAYDLSSLRPRPKCALEQDARVVRTLAVDSLRTCATDTNGGGLSTALLEAPELTRATAEWLASVLDVGGVLVQLYPSMSRREELWRLYKDRQTFAEALVPARHHIQALPRKGSPGTVRWTLACSGIDFYRTHKPSLVALTTSEGPEPLLDWLAGVPARCDVCEASDLLRHPEKSLEACPRENLGSRLSHLPIPPTLKYPGRWLEGATPCLSLTRLEIDAEGNVRPCRHADPIGKVGDDRSLLTARLAARVAETERRRDCASCPAARCSRCPFPGMEDHAYCEIMREQTNALDLLEWAHLYSRLPSLLTMQRDRTGGD